ncbi:MAG: MFS transporter [Proteobacteria bacterium]|nr:MFS transporter [Pseudomonadota bacterium]
MSVEISPAKTATPSHREANYVLAVLFVVIMLNFLDRQVISIVAEPIKQEMGLSDKQIGLMTGLSFALFYTTLAIPVALLADKWHRSRIIAIAVGVWSLMTILCGAANNFIQLFLARVGVGIGESASGPASHSLIADYFPPERRASAMGVYGAAVPLGAFVALAGGGWIVENFNWRTAFYIAGAPGIFIALIVWWSVKEPRGHVSLKEAFKPQPDQQTLKEALTELWSKPTYWHLVMAGILIQFVSYGTAAFYGSLYVRVFGVGYGELGLKLGLMVAIAGMSGAWLGGKVGDKFDKERPGSSLKVIAATFIVAVPCTFAAVSVDSINLSICLLGVTTFAATFYYGPNFSLIQTLAGDRTRAMAVAIYLLFAGLIGLGFGPIFVGAVSDFISGGDPSLEANGIRGGVAAIALFNLWTAFHFWRAQRLVAAG